MSKDYKFSRRRILKSTTYIGAASIGGAGITAADDASNDDSDDISKTETKELLKIANGEIKPIEGYTDTPVDRIAERMNSLISNDKLSLSEDNADEFDVEHIEGLEDFEGSDTESGGISIMSHGENSFSGDRSAWGTPFQNHRVKFNSEVSQEFSYVLGQGADYTTLLSILIGLASFAYATKVAALAAAGAVYMENRSRRFDHYDEGHGVAFNFRWAEVPTTGGCGLILPGGTCDDIDLGPLTGLYVFYDSNYDSQ